MASGNSTGKSIIAGAVGGLVAVAIVGAAAAVVMRKFCPQMMAELMGDGGCCGEEGSGGCCGEGGCDRDAKGADCDCGGECDCGKTQDGQPEVD